MDPWFTLGGAEHRESISLGGMLFRAAGNKHYKVKENCPLIPDH